MTLIDPHVHLRDWRQAAKETVEHGLRVAWRAGISALFEMPNTDPALTTTAMIERRIATADTARAAVRATAGEAPFHALYAGLTANPTQIRAVVRAHARLFPRVVGLKLFAGHSTGRMGVVTVTEQFAVWRTLARVGYRGVVAVHAEREDLLQPSRHDHNAARPPLAELASVQTQLALAEAAGFRGTMHIAHVTQAAVAMLVHQERSGLPFRVTTAATPHHLLISAPDPPRVNPPIRPQPYPSDLRRALNDGLIDWIESDHAPHTAADLSAGASGVPGIPGFRLLVECLRATIPTARFGTAVLEAFAVPAALIPHNPQAEEPFTAARYRELAGEYPLDPYAGARKIELFPAACDNLPIGR